MQPQKGWYERESHARYRPDEKKNVSLEIQSDSKNYVSVQDDEIPSLLSLCIL